MLGQRYRLRATALAILDPDGQRLLLTIPQGAVVRVVAGPLDGGRFVDVEWEGKTVIMFTKDIREHGELVEGARN
jgi:hypothetical protein